MLIPVATSVEALAFNEEEVLRLTGLTLFKLRHWMTSNVVRGDYPETFDEGPRLYSFQDLIALRVLAQLRKKHSLQALRRVGEFLRTFDPERPWTRLRLFVNDKGGLFVRDPVSGRKLRAIGPEGQVVVEDFLLDMSEVSHKLQRDVARERTRSPDVIGRVHRKRGTAGSRPIIMGTRIPVAIIQRLRTSGLSIDAIRRRYPQLTADDVRAAVEHRDPPRNKATA